MSKSLTLDIVVHVGGSREDSSKTSLWPEGSSV